VEGGSGCGPIGGGEELRGCMPSLCSAGVSEEVAETGASAVAVESGGRWASCSWVVLVVSATGRGAGAVACVSVWMFGASPACTCETTRIRDALSLAQNTRNERRYTLNQRWRTGVDDKTEKVPTGPQV
jgi:hypothetical protein